MAGTVLFCTYFVGMFFHLCIKSFYVIIWQIFFIGHMFIYIDLLSQLNAILSSRSSSKSESYPGLRPRPHLRTRPQTPDTPISFPSKSLLNPSLLSFLVHVASFTCSKDPHFSSFSFRQSPPLLLIILYCLRHQDLSLVPNILLYSHVHDRTCPTFCETTYLPRLPWDTCPANIYLAFNLF